MSEQKRLTRVEAVGRLRADPAYADIIRDSYLEADVRGAAERFLQSAEFAEACALLGGRLAGGTALDLGAGTGIASHALARAGAGLVYALEPDSSEIGRGAIAQLTEGLPVRMLDAVAEHIPLGDEAVDFIYARQVLHHARDLGGALRECARVLKRGGLLLACREHVADDEEQLAEFLAGHAVHQLSGGEHAFPLEAYVGAITEAGLVLKRTLGPRDSIINAFPALRTKAELDSFPEKLLRTRFGRAGALLRFVPGVRPLVRRRIRRDAYPGRLYSFIAVKPGRSKS